MDMNPAPTSNQMALRGVLVVLALIAAGAFVLARGLNDDSPKTTTAAATPTATAAPDPTEEPPAPTQPPTTSNDNTPTTNNTEPSTPQQPPALPSNNADNTDNINTDENSSATTSTDETPECRDPATIQVLAANTTNVRGAAGNLSGELNAANYVTLPPVNAAPQPSSSFYYRAGYEVDARCIANLLGVSAGPFFVMPDPPPGGISRERLGNAFVLVMIGPDSLANRG